MPTIGPMPPPAALIADALVLLHLAFIAFVVLGGIAVAFRPPLALLHLPALAWGAWVEFSGAICPLTPLENAWRARAGEAGYAGGFVEHYVVALVYPAGLTPAIQVGLGIAVLAINAAVYAWAIRRLRRRRLG